MELQVLDILKQVVIRCNALSFHLLRPSKGVISQPPGRGEFRGGLGSGARSGTENWEKRARTGAEERPSRRKTLLHN